MPDVTWEPCEDYTSANRAEMAVVGDYELIAADLPETPRQDAAISWELYGPPDATTLITWGKSGTFEEAKATAEAALAETLKDI